jgi:hypothetical protein
VCVCTYIHIYIHTLIYFAEIPGGEAVGGGMAATRAPVFFAILVPPTWDKTGIWRRTCYVTCTAVTST